MTREEAVRTADFLGTGGKPHFVIRTDDAADGFQQHSYESLQARGIALGDPRIVHSTMNLAAVAPGKIAVKVAGAAAKKTEKTPPVPVAAVTQYAFAPISPELHAFTAIQLEMTVEDVVSAMKAVYDSLEAKTPGDGKRRLQAYARMYHKSLEATEPSEAPESKGS